MPGNVQLRLIGGVTRAAGCGRGLVSCVVARLSDAGVCADVRLLAIGQNLNSVIGLRAEEDF